MLKYLCLQNNFGVQGLLHLVLAASVSLDPIRLDQVCRVGAIASECFLGAFKYLVYGLIEIPVAGSLPVSFTNDNKVGVWCKDGGWWGV